MPRPRRRRSRARSRRDEALSDANAIALLGRWRERADDDDRQVLIDMLYERGQDVAAQDLQALDIEYRDIIRIPMIPRFGTARRVHAEIDGGRLLDVGTLRGNPGRLVERGYRLIETKAGDLLLFTERDDRSWSRHRSYMLSSFDHNVRRMFDAARAEIRLQQHSTAEREQLRALRRQWP